MLNHPDLSSLSISFEYKLSLFSELTLKMMDPKFLSQENFKSSSFIFLISEYNITQLLVGGLSIFLTLFLIKSVYLIFLNYGINKFIFQVQAELGKKLFNKYLNNPLSFHLKNNSSFLLRNISEEIHFLSEGILLQGMIFFAESLVTLFLISFFVLI